MIFPLCLYAQRFKATHIKIIEFFGVVFGNRCRPFASIETVRYCTHRFAVNVINTSIANGYQGLFKPNSGYQGRKSGRDVNQISQPDKKIPTGFRG
ncbi:hypothetical protein FL826_07785 [Salmonella enterica subsp. enterica]|nr:hypothetical protein [Salmonella enterica subsp. enterica serovar Sandiego]